MTEETRLLIVEDVGADAELAVRELKRAGLSCTAIRVETKADYLRQLEEFSPDIILCDFSLPHFDGMSALAIAHDRHPEMPFIFVSGTIGEEAAIESLKSGATDYVLKTNLARLGSAVKRALQEAEDRRNRRQTEVELARIRERTNSIFSSLRDVICSVSPDMRQAIYVNAATQEVFGRPPEEFVANPGLWFEVIHPDDAQRVRDAWQQVAAEKAIDIEYRILRPDGAVRWIHNRARLVRSAGDGETRIDGIASDVTDRKRQEEKILRLSRIERVLSGVNSAIVRIRDRDELLREACRIAVEDGGFALAWVGLVDPQTLDIRPHAWMGEERGFLGMIRPSAREDILEGRGVSGAAIRTGKPVVVNDVATDERLIHREETLARGFRSFVVLPLLVGTESAGSLHFYARDAGFFDQDELKLLADLAGDISFALAAMEKEERLNYLAYYDVLTGLLNRRLFHERVDQFVLTARETRGRIALLVLDLQRFGIINDTLGRQAGDAVLKQVGARLRHALEDRHPVARLSVDTFGIVLAGIKDDADVAHALEQKIIGSVSRPFSVAGQELRPSLKCGVALFPGDGMDAEQLFRNAEAALKKAKASGDKYLFYAPQMNARVAEKLALENRLRTAVVDEQFVLHYQPKVEIATRRIIGLEALIRWRSPELGMVPPNEFVPLLEETGLILDVGKWVLNQAVRDYQRWAASGLNPPRIAVNISPLHLRQPNFANDIRRLAAQDGAGILQLDLEITESLIMEDIEHCIAKLETIRAAGIGIAIDDFGTGYSSLSYIARLPVTSLKIDRSFIADMTSSAHNMTIVSTIISLAHCLNLKVTAEGVETKEQLQLLKLLRCDEMQGYLFSPPLPPEEIEGLIGNSTQPAPSEA
ncbi:MAG: EAL domain-containing protein [Betaproteobacteria bacterium]|nr:EAL domain-containing protein [Betaproteobacteria bacterium]